MFYEDLFDLEEDYVDKHKKYASGFSSIFELKREKKFYALYSALIECHGIMIKNKMYEYDLYDIRRMKPSERILEVSHKDDIHFFDIESFMECQIKDHSLLIKNTKHEDVELIPVQIRSMITDGTITK
tara:strand:- start:960 stop:1343 length:384 start_codon:yes stop_codon:yes gene_type:complete